MFADKTPHSTIPPASDAHDFKPVDPSALQFWSEQVNTSTSYCNKTCFNRKVQQLVEKFDFMGPEPLAEMSNESISEEIIYFCGKCGPITAKELDRIFEERRLESFVVGLFKTGTYADLIQEGMCYGAVDIH
jgi:hypothetical protein